MSKPDLDWSFDYIPAADEGAAAAPVMVEALAAPARSRRWWSRAPRWLLLGLMALVTGVVAAGAVFQRVGWQRVVAQVSHEVISEDSYARAGDVTMVRSFLAPDDSEWTALRAAEARLGLAVTLPAGHLRPLDEPPEVEAVDVLEGAVFQATLQRAFADPAGQVYHFRYVQRYRNLGPGLWERLPVDQAALALQARWTGQRLVATFPMDDWVWMERAVPRIDAWLAQACADWQCPSSMKVSLTLTSQPDELRPLRGASTAPEPGPPSSPIVFGLNQQRPLFPSRLVLPSLQVAGVPVEDAASEALVRALTVHALVHLAQQLSGLAQDNADFYLEALVARAEARLGLSPALRYSPLPDGYVPPPGLWSRGLGGRAVDLPRELPYRLQALAFLNYALADEPPQTDGELLRGLRRQTGLVPWLLAELGPTAARLPADWTARVTTASGPGTPLAWQRLDGLTYTCDDGAWLIRGRGLEALWAGDAGQPSIASSLSASGRYVASLRFSTVNGVGQLRVLEVDTGQAEVAAQARFIAVLGWSADDSLLYLQSGVPEAAGRGGVRLMRYDPVTGVGRAVIPNPVRPLGLSANGASEANWAPDRSAVALTVNLAQAGAPARWEAALVPLATPSPTPERVLGLAEGSYAPILAPDGGHAAYGRELSGAPILMLHDLATQTRRRLVSAAALAQPLPGVPGQPDQLLPMAWSPDGAVLLFLATGAEYGDHLFIVGADGLGLRHLAGMGEAGWVSPLGFSPDGQYLGYFEASLDEPAARLQVLDTASGEVQNYPVFPGSVSWSTEGHLLALAAEDGAYVLNPATGDRRWLAFQTCQKVSW